MREIPITKCAVALVDDADYDRVSAKKWCLSGNGRYAIRLEGPYKKRHVVYMHRFILGLPPGLKTDIDHIDGNGLNNTKSNLRTATRGQNLANKGVSAHNTSGFRGVSRKGNSWLSVITVAGTDHRLGMYDDKIEAATVYDAALIHAFGPYAKTNLQYAEPPRLPAKYTERIPAYRPESEQEFIERLIDYYCSLPDDVEVSFDGGDWRYS